MDILYTHYILYGIGFIAILVFLFLFHQSNVNGFVKRFDSKLRARVFPVSISKLRIRYFLLLLASVLIVFSLLRPIVYSGKEKVESVNLDIAIALDISPSMLAMDVRPDRLSRAKREVYSLLKSLPDYRVSLVLFSGQAILQVPLTTDYSAINLMLENISPDYISNRGTDIRDALTVAHRSLSSSRTEGIKKMILLITDGEDHSAGLKRVLKELKNDSIIVYTIGVGSLAGAPIPVYHNGQVSEYLKDKNGKAVISKLEGMVLNNIASATAGKLYMVDQSSFNLRRIVDDIISIETKKSFVETRTKDFSDLYQYFLFAAVLVIIAALMMSQKQGVFLSLLFLFVLNDINFAAPFNFFEWMNNFVANRHFTKQEVDRAVNKYMSNTRIDSNNPVTHYNLGNGLVAKGSFEEANKEWQTVLDNSKNNKLKSQVQFNLGLSKLKQQDYEAAKNQFIETLKLNPEDLDAKKNLELVLKQIKKQKKQQKSKPKEDKQNKEGKKKKTKKDEQNKEDETKSGSKSKEGIDKEKAMRILDKYKNNKTFNPNKEKRKAGHENNW